MAICPSCHAGNRDDQKFCGECGAPLVGAGGTAREERKVVTVLFTDLVGFTSRSERLDPEDVRAMLSPYYSRLRSEIERYGGTVEKFIGDAVMAVFGAPVAHEDDPERAVRAALAIREAIRDLNSETASLELAIRTGVNTGEALVALGARPSEGEGMVSGDVVNTAARLQSAAPVDGILVGEMTFRATRHAINYGEASPVELKGKAEPLPVWQALDARSRFGVDVDADAIGVLIGRERERGFLVDALERSRTDETAQLVTLVGVPGIGKSRLVAELFRIVDAAPEIIWWRQGRSLPYGETQSFWALAEIVKAHAGILESDDLETVATKLGAMLETALSDGRERTWIERHLQPLVGIASAAGPTGDRGSEAFSAWRRLLEALAEQRPLVLVFEDLHWADDGLLDFVDHLADWVTTVPMLIVGTARPELLERRPGWGGGKRNASTVSLEPLTESETALLLGSLLEQALLPADVQAGVVARAAGNPLYAEEYVRMLQDSGFLARDRHGWRLVRDDDFPLPETVQGMIAARIDALPAAEKKLVQDAAVIGKVFWPTALAAIAGMDADRLGEPLHALERKDFIRRDRQSSVVDATQYAFLHVLVRDVAYAQIPRARRAEKHLAAAQWIEALARDRTDDRAEMLAHHYRLALELVEAAGGDASELKEPARTALAAASERAESLNAWPAARDQAREALALTDPSDPLAAQLGLRLTRALFLLGEYDVEVAVTAREQSLANGDVEHAAEAEALQSLMLWWRGDGDTAIVSAERAVTLLADRPASPAKAWVLANRARRACLLDDHETALPLANEVLSMAEELGRDDYASHALNTRGMTLLQIGDLGGIGDLEESIAVAERANAADELSTGCNNLANHLRALGRLDDGGAYFRRLRSVAEHYGLAAHLVWSDFEEVSEAYLRGDYGELITRGEDFLAGHEDGSLYQEAPLRNMLAHGYTALGRTGDALAHSARGLPLARTTGDSQTVGLALLARAHVASAVGRREEAASCLDEILAAPKLLAYFVWLAPLPLLLSEHGRGAEFAAAMKELTHETPWRVAAMAVAQGRFVEAAGLYEEIGSRFVEAWARLLAAEAGEDARNQLSKAAGYFERVGADPYLARCETLLAASA